QGMHPLTPLLPYDHFNPGATHTASEQKPGGTRRCILCRLVEVSDNPSLHPVSKAAPLTPGTIEEPQREPANASASLRVCERHRNAAALLRVSFFHWTPRFGQSLFSPSLMGIPHPAIVPPSAKQELQNFNLYPKSQGEVKREKEPKKPVIKKPLNAFMLYMKEMRAKVIAECTLKESAAINQILGRRWHALTREEQSKYYELARKERQLHMQLYPSWSARDNYTPALLRNAALASASTIRATGVAPAGEKRSAFASFREDAAPAHLPLMEAI
ncbi:hypothetical protein DNTS_018383, partial [Danionella cerebrum]